MLTLATPSPVLEYITLAEYDFMNFHWSDRCSSLRLTMLLTEGRGKPNMTNPTFYSEKAIS